MCISSDFTNIRLKGKDNTPEKMKEYEYVADVAKELPQTGAGESTVYMSAKKGEQKKCEIVECRNSTPEKIQEYVDVVAIYSSSSVTF